MNSSSSSLSSDEVDSTSVMNFTPDFFLNSIVLQSGPIFHIRQTWNSITSISRAPSKSSSNEDV